MRSPSAAVLCAAFTLALFSAGCGPEAQPPPRTAGGYWAPYAYNPAAYSPYGQPYVGYAQTNEVQSVQPSSQSESSVHVDQKIIKACGNLPTAHFAFDSANVLPESSAALDALAQCFVSGPLKNASLKLIGHADPRGETEYNLALGQQRAYSVLDILAQRGIQLHRMSTSSKGEFEATGNDEAGWARDRKVEVMLAE